MDEIQPHMTNLVIFFTKAPDSRDFVKQSQESGDFVANLLIFYQMPISCMKSPDTCEFVKNPKNLVILWQIW